MMGSTRFKVEHFLLSYNQIVEFRKERKAEQDMVITTTALLNHLMKIVSIFGSHPEGKVLVWATKGVGVTR